MTDESVPKTSAYLTLLWCWLTLRAEVAAAVADGDVLNRGTTDRAELATQAVGNLELKVGCPQCSIGTEVGIHAGTLITNG